MKSIVDNVTVCDVDQTSHVIEEGGESPLERVSVVHKVREIIVYFDSCL